MKRIYQYCKQTLFLPILALIFLISAFIVDSPSDVFKGYALIIKSPSILITDYSAIGGLGATFFNVATVLIFNLVLIEILDLKVYGLIYAGIVCIVGFSFFGKNIFNSLPIYLGIYLYSAIKKIPYKNLIVTVLFSTGMSPLVSYCIFGFGFPLYYGIPLGLVCGILTGLIIAPLANHTIKFHQGYSLYNTGFALGLISIFFYSVFTTFELDVQTVKIVTEEFHNTYFILLVLLTVLPILAAIIMDKSCLKQYKLVLKRSGRLVTDFIRDYGQPVVLLNFGLLNGFFLILTMILNVKFDGAVFGTVIAVSGFASTGLHLRNTVSVVLGAILSVYVSNIRDFNDTSVFLSILLVTGLAPIAGRYGAIAGVVSGFIHVMFAPLALKMQGGFDLYNNGFASGFVACIVVVVIESLKKENDQ